MTCILVRQPNGLLARYEPDARRFTDMNMSRDQAVTLLISEVGEDVALNKAIRAEEDDDCTPWEMLAPVGIRRWMGCLVAVAQRHGHSMARLAKQDGEAKPMAPSEEPAGEPRQVVGYLLKETHANLDPPCHHYLRCRWTGWEHPRFYFPDDSKRRGAFPLTRKQAHRLARKYRKQGRKVTVVRLVRP